MNRIFRSLPLVTPWILFVLFLQILFFQIEFKVDRMEKQPLEILMESETEESESLSSEWTIRKGAIYKLSSLSGFLRELKSDEIPQDGFIDMTYERLSRIVFGQKLILIGIAFLCLLCLSSFFAWLNQAWFRITLSKTLHWIAFFTTLFSLGNPLPHILKSGLAIFLTVFYVLLFIYLIFSYFAINAGKSESTAFEVLKHTSELDEEGKKPTQKVEWKPIRVAYHFIIIILVGLFVGNLVYTPLFLLQKHYSYEFGILLITLIALLCAFYIRNYSQLSKDNNVSKLQNILSSVAYLQYKFIRNFAMGLGATIMIVIFVTILFSILIMNADVLKHPDLGIIEKSAEF
jgi:F0F1-type ATP synthase assembly protein I